MQADLKGRSASFARDEGSSHGFSNDNSLLSIEEITQDNSVDIGMKRTMVD